jgi:hypothetical protein
MKHWPKRRARESHSPIWPASILDETTQSRLLLDTRPWLSCDDCFEKMDTYVEALLRGTGHDDMPMRTHLAGCSACAEEADGLLALLAEESDPSNRRATSTL